MESSARATLALLFDNQLRELASRKVPSGRAGTRAARYAKSCTGVWATWPARTNGPANHFAEWRAVCAGCGTRDEGTRRRCGTTCCTLAIIVLAGLFCYWLARYLTAPVTKLRAATQELARGNLSARVAPAFGTAGMSWQIWQQTLI